MFCFAVFTITALALTSGAQVRRMKILISADMEGVTGVVTGEQLSPQGFEYQRFREIMTQEVNTAIEAAFAAGATEITVAPQTFELPMPSLGSGVLGRHLLALSQRIGPGDRAEPRCNEYIKESFKTLDSILLPSFRGGRGAVAFVAGALVVKGIGARVEWARLEGGGIDASGWRFGLTVR